MSKHCSGLNCEAVEDGSVPHSSECQFEHMCAVKGIDTVRSLAGVLIYPRAKEAWDIWQWAWSAEKKKDALHEDT